MVEKNETQMSMEDIVAELAKLGEEVEQYYTSTGLSEQGMPEIQLDPNAEMGTFVTMQISVNEEGAVSAGIVEVPIDLRLIRRFQEQYAEQMDKEGNIKFIIHQKRAFICPVRTSSLILPGQ